MLDLGLVGAALARATFEAENLGTALASLRAATARDSLLLRERHQLAHALGRRAVQAGGDDASVIAQCTPMFASGCYHGVVEGLLRRQGRIDMGDLEGMCLGAGATGRARPTSAYTGSGMVCLAPSPTMPVRRCVTATP